jgi:hypothetical protein
LDKAPQHVFFLCLIIDAYHALAFYFYFWAGVLGGFEMYWLMDGRVIVMRDCYGEDA